jgi:hypothetical protein
METPTEQGTSKVPEGGSPAPAPPPEAETVPPHDPDEIRHALESVAWVQGLRDGVVSFLPLLAVFATVVCSAVAYFGGSQLISNAVEKAVTTSLASHLETIRSELEGYAQRAGDAAASAESASARAEAAGDRADESALQAAADAATAEAVPTALAAMATQSAELAARGQWTVVVASAGSIEDARSEADRILRVGYTSTIYKVGNFYAVTIGTFGTREQAEASLIEIRAAVQVSAFPLDLAQACPYQQYFQAGFYGCYFTPPE